VFKVVGWKFEPELVLCACMGCYFWKCRGLRHLMVLKVSIVCKYSTKRGCCTKDSNLFKQKRASNKAFVLDAEDDAIMI